MIKLKELFKNKKLLALIGIGIILFFTMTLIRGCKKPKPLMPARPVTTAMAFEQDAQIYVDSFGSLRGLNDVDIKSQVTGQLKEVRFTEGGRVTMGQALFLIDPAPYKASLDKAQAQLASDAADMEIKKLTFERNKQLFDKGLISGQDFDTYRTDFESARAKTDLAKANVELAKINLDYCSIVSPVNGVAGKRQVDIGNIVSENNGPVLVNIKSIDSLYIDFSIPEKYLPQTRDAMKLNKLNVEIRPEGDEANVYTGVVECLDNTVDNSTGTFLMRAIVQNKEAKLWPGQFSKTRLILGVKKTAVLVPIQAVQLGQNGSYLFVITAQNKADLRNVKTGSRQDDSIVIEGGVSSGEKVVTSGQMGLSPGVAVQDVGQK